MVSRGVADIIVTMEREEKRLRDQHAQALRTAHHLRSELHRLEQAYLALTGKTAADAEADPILSSREELPQRLSRSRIGSYIERILAEQNRLTEPKLLDAISTLAVADGFTRNRVERVFHRALRSGPFRFNGAHWVIDETR